MSQIKKDTPRNITIMAAATLAALGFAVWSIAHTLSPTAAPHATAEPRPAHPEETAAATEKPPVEPDRALAKAEEHTRNAQEQEAHLAPGADPFAPLPATRPHRNPPTVPQQPATPDISAKASPAPPAPATPASTPAQTSAENTTFLPVLAGTLLGKQPCAVFLDEKQLSVIPVGSSLNGWKIVAVTHGRATLKRGKRILHLKVSPEPAPEEPGEQPASDIEPETPAEPAGTGQKTPATGSSGPAEPPVLLELPEAVLSREELPEAEPAAETETPDSAGPEPETPQP